MSDWYMKINPLFPLYFYTVVTFLIYLAGYKNIILAAMVVVTIIQLCFLLWRKSSKYFTLADQDIEESFEDDVNDLGWDYFYENINKPGIREKLKYRMLAHLIVSIIIIVLTVSLTLIEVYTATIIGVILIIASAPRLIKSFSIYSK